MDISHNTRWHHLLGPVLLAGPGVNAEETELQKTDFSHCHLFGARFRKADLAEANFSQADLRGVDFSQADLTGAQFLGANVDGAQLESAKLGEHSIHGVKGEPATLPDGWSCVPDSSLSSSFSLIAP